MGSKEKVQTIFNNQYPLNNQISEYSRPESFEILKIDYWNLFGNWELGLGYLPLNHLKLNQNSKFEIQIILFIFLNSKQEKL